MKNNQKDIEQLYLSLKRDYDSLLEKNQNDLVKIRIKEKMLNEKIQQIQRQREQQVQVLTLEVQSLKRQLQSRNTTNIPVKDLTKQSEIESLNQKLANSIKKYNDLEKKFRSQQKEKLALRTTASQVQELRQRIELLQVTNQRLREEANLNQIKLSQAISQAENNQQTITLLQQDNQRLDRFLRQLQQKIQQQARPCQNCLNLQQQLQLQKEMLKSVRTMLKFKEMELQAVKK